MERPLKCLLGACVASRIRIPTVVLALRLVRVATAQRSKVTSESRSEIALQINLYTRHVMQWTSGTLAIPLIIGASVSEPPLVDSTRGEANMLKILPRILFHSAHWASGSEPT